MVSPRIDVVMASKPAPSAPITSASDVGADREAETAEQTTNEPAQREKEGDLS